MPERDIPGSLTPDFIEQVFRRPVSSSSADSSARDQRFSVQLGDPQDSVALSIFPHLESVSVMGTHVMVELTGISQVLQRDGRLRFERVTSDERAVMEVSPDGGVVVAREPAAPGDSGELPPLPERHRRQTTEAPRITLRGRIGADPRYRATRQRGELVATFPLGVHPDKETTEWHTVILFGDRARRLQDKGYRKGQEVEVVGYVHERQSQPRSGETRTITELYAVAVSSVTESQATANTSKALNCAPKLGHFKAPG